MSGGAVTTAAAIVGMSVGAITLYGLSVRVYRRSIGRRRNVTARLNQLACGTTVEYVEGLFGPPVFRRPHGQRRVEHLYYTTYAWLQVIYDGSSNAVDAFAITALSGKLGFKTRELTFDNINIRLGHNRFKDIEAFRDSSTYVLGARRYHYSEAYYFGNPGCYQWYVVAATRLGWKCMPSHASWPNLQGWTTGRFRAILSLAAIRATPDAEPADIDTHRAFFVVDTLKVIGPGGGDELIAGWPGAEPDLVRLLRPTGAGGWVQRRQVRRRITKARRSAARTYPHAGDQAPEV